MAKRIPWPEQDENEYYENETSFLSTLVGAWEDAGGTTWAGIAREINAKFNNNRSASACSRKAEKEHF